MRLEKFMKEAGLGDAELGRRIGELLKSREPVPRVTVRQWRLGQRKPRDPEIIEAIRKLSRRRVTANDFYGSAA